MPGWHTMVAMKNGKNGQNRKNGQRAKHTSGSPCRAVAQAGALCLSFTLAVALSPCLAGAQEHTPPPAPPGALQIFFVDVEGGQATLFVTPGGHSLLVDTGWPDGDGRDSGRDAKRIVDAMRLAHLTRLDAVLITHYHTDHAGGVPQLVARVPVGLFLDHGPNREANDSVTAHSAEAYGQVIAGGGSRHQVLHPGDKLPVPGFDGTVVSSDGAVLASAMPGAGAANPFCGDAGQAEPDRTENSRSLGFVLGWGRARILDLGDLTRDKEKDLMCPNNRLGHIDLLVVSHHGWYQSSSRALVDALTPRVAVMDNGEVKGGSIPVLDTLKQAPSHPALWQLHYSSEGGPAHNTAAAHIANLNGTAQHSDGPDAGYFLRATVTPGGAISLWNSRTGNEARKPAP